MTLRKGEENEKSPEITADEMRDLLRLSAYSGMRGVRAGR